MSLSKLSFSSDLDVTRCSMAPFRLSPSPPPCAWLPRYLFMEASCTIVISMKPLKTELQRVDIVIMDALDACHLCYPGNCAILAAHLLLRLPRLTGFSHSAQGKKKRRERKSCTSALAHNFKQGCPNQYLVCVIELPTRCHLAKSIPSFSSWSHVKFRPTRNDLIQEKVREKRTFKCSLVFPTWLRSYVATLRSVSVKSVYNPLASSLSKLFTPKIRLW